MKAALSIAFDNLRGKAGNVVVSKARSGLVVKPRIHGRNPQTPAQQAIRADLAQAAVTFKSMTVAQVANWKEYAATITKTNPVTGETYHPSAITAFTGLATKVLQITPGGTIPLTPPNAPFTGDPLTVTTTASSGQITFTATGPNRPGTQTELLLQELPSPHRAPSPRAYRPKALATFTPGTLSVDVPVPPGNYAAAYRFVDPATGQSTPLQPLPTQQVPAQTQAQKAA